MSTSILTFEARTGIREITPAAGGMSSGVRVFTTGRNAKGRFASWDVIRLTVTARGHWYRSDDPRDDFHNDTVCRGCGHHGHFDYILDYKPCTKPPTASDIEDALLGWHTPKPTLDKYGLPVRAHYTVTGGTEF